MPSNPDRPNRADRNASPDPGFEVVEDHPGFEVVDEAPSPSAKRRKPGKVERSEGGEEPPARLRKPRRKKKRPAPVVDEGQESRDRALAEFEWIWPSVLLVLGVVMTLVGAFGASKVGAFYTIGVMFVGLVVSIPLTIAVLMIVGIVMGIEYGRFGPAILKIAAITLVVNGVMFLANWAKLPAFVVFPITCAISFGLFMTQFSLDTWETNVSIGALNILSFVTKVVLVGFLVLAETKRNDLNNEDEPDDPTPSDTRRDPGMGKRTQTPPSANPDDTDDDP